MCLPQTTTFFGNQVEVCAIAKTRSAIEAARRLCALGANEVVIHRGRRGAVAVTGSRRFDSPARSVAIDNPTGCGDVFNAAYVYRRLRGAEISDALRFANACAALHLKDRRRPYPKEAIVARFARRFGSF